MNVGKPIIIGIKMKKKIDIKYSFNEDRPCSLCKIIKSASKFTSRKLPSGNYGRMSRCNKALGSFKDDVDLLKSAIIYLEKHNG
jgi:hypothetical protein